MKKNSFLLFFMMFSVSIFADKLNIATYFVGKSGCFMLYDLNNQNLVTEYNPERCQQRITPASTFKIPLSLMAFDQHLINQHTLFRWDGQNRSLAIWNQDQTPRSWLQNSTVWVSQLLTSQLGLTTIQTYLNKFNYGNQDFSGDPGKNNALTQAWLGSSLKISAVEQLKFLTQLVKNQLPVSKPAMNATQKNMYIETSVNGWAFYGKTGSKDLPDPAQHINRHDLNQKYPRQDGWFIGFVEKNNQTYIFVVNFTDINNPNTDLGSGLRAKQIAKDLLMRMNLL